MGTAEWMIERVYSEQQRKIQIEIEYCIYKKFDFCGDSTVIVLQKK